jgi:hypothetical protein
MTKHINVFNTMGIHLASIDIKMSKEYKCITLLCSLPDSWDNLVVAISNTTTTTLNFEDVVASLLSKRDDAKIHGEFSQVCLIYKRLSL